MELYVVRHGQTDYNRKNLFQGHKDIPLNNVGIQQAQQIALEMSNIKFDKILVSPLKRAIQTAEYIKEKVDVSIIIENSLIERSFGNMEGKTNREDCNIQMMLDYKKNINKENIEPIQTFFQRIYTFLDYIKEKYKNEKIILVTHGSVSQVIECYFNGLPEEPNYESLEKMTLKNGEIKKYSC